jgi:hypothetical protein
MSAIVIADMADLATDFYVKLFLEGSCVKLFLEGSDVEAT